MSIVIGIEKEYTIYAKCMRNGEIFGTDFSALFFTELSKIQSTASILSINLKKLKEKGWKILPEFSKAIIEVISPPYKIDDLRSLVDGFLNIEDIFHYLSNIMSNSQYEVFITDKYCSLSTKFINSKYEEITNLDDMYLNGKNTVCYLNDLQKKIPKIPNEINKLDMKPIHLFALFTSTNITISNEMVENFNDLVNYFWILLLNFAELSKNTKSNNFLFNESKHICSKSVREILLDWIDPKGRFLLSKIYEDKKQQLEAYSQIFGTEMLEDSFYKKLYVYAARPRIFDKRICIEIRCLPASFDINRVQEGL